MGSPINYSAPQNPAKSIAQSNGRVNPYLSSSPYENMQLHTPSGMYYNNGKIYESYTPDPVQQVMNTMRSPFGPSAPNPGTVGGPNQGGLFGMNNNLYTTIGGPVEGSIQSGDQYFKPYTGNAPGIIDGDISMIYGLGNRTTPTYSAQQMQNLFPGLNTNFSQSQPTGSMLGAGRFLGNTTSSLPIVTTNTQGK
jgi:hypothetical protein